MAGLVGYASSSDGEDDDIPQQGQMQTEVAPTNAAVDSREATEKPTTPPSVRPIAQDAASLAQRPPLGPQLGSQHDPEALKDAPVLGPSLPTGEEVIQMQTDADAAAFLDSLDPSSRPQSPYTANRALLRDLTLPPVPNLDVPPSPPGTPPPSLGALTAKFETFLELKRKKGTHFNARLAQSTAMRNPSLMDKLLDFVGLEDPVAASETKSRPGAPKGAPALASTNSMADQYITVLPPDIWDPTSLPEWAFRGELRKAQEKVQKEREAERASGQRDAIEFVPPSSARRA